MKLWGKYFKDKRIQIFFDEAVCQVTSWVLLHSGLREIAYLAAILEFEIKTVHLDSKTNRFSDLLSSSSRTKNVLQVFFFSI